jgi:hypothetical protein
MPFLSGSVTILEFNRASYTRKLDEAIQEIYRDGLKLFVQAVIDHIPVETGMARGALQPLAEFLGEQIETLGAQPRGGRSFASGAQSSLFEVVSWEFPRYEVRLKVEVINGWWWDNYATLFNVAAKKEVTAGPWRSIEHGREVFRDYVRAHMRFAIPDIQQFMTRTRKPYGR